MDMLSEEALPLLVLMSSHAFLGGRVDFLIGQLHEVLEASAVVVEMRGVVRRIQEDSRVRKRPYFSILRSAFRNVICPQESGQSSCRLPSDCDLSGNREQLVGQVDGVQLRLGHSVSSEVEVLALVADWVLLVALVASAVAVLQVHNGPILEVVLGHIAQDACRCADSRRIRIRAPKGSLAPLKAGLECLGESSAVSAPSSALKAQQELSGLLALSDVVSALGAIQTQRFIVSHHDLLEGMRREYDRNQTAQDDCSLWTVSHYLQDTQKIGTANKQSGMDGV